MTTKNNKNDDSMFKSENVGKSKPRKKTAKRVKKEVVTEESRVAQYIHPSNKRKNNPPVGMVDPNNDPDQPSTRYSYDPRLDPQLQWSGKTENSEFDVDTVSLHVHEKIDPLTIIEKTLKNHKQIQQSLFHYFDMPENNPPLRDAIEFYKHDQNWSNRLIAGDSLLVMNSLLQKETMNGKIQMIYIDPPYGIRYGSNFQPFVNKKDVNYSDKDEDLSREPEVISAFRDTWELGIHSYLTYLKKRLILAKELLTESGSCFIQISDENIHLVRQLVDEIFGSKNFVSQIIFAKTSGFTTSALASTNDYIIWYAKDKSKLKYRPLFLPKDAGTGIQLYRWIELPDGTRRKLTKEERETPSMIPKGKIFRISDIQSQGETGSDQKFIFNGQTFYPRKGNHWTITVEGLNELSKKNRLIIGANIPQFVRYLDDYPVKTLTNIWTDTATGSFTAKKIYAVQTATKVIQRCILMTTDPGDLVFDPTCGSGTTAFVAEQFGRRWITCDSSRISIALTKQRLMTSIYDYYELAYAQEGILGGFKFNRVPHATIHSVAFDENNFETLYDQPIINKEKIRISGPFTIEAVPSPIVNSIDVLSKEAPDQINTNPTTQQEWRDELLKTGIRLTNNKKLEFSKVQSHPATKWLHVDAETKEAKPKRVMISFGPEYSLLDQRQVAKAIEESQTLVPKPDIIIFVALQFDPEAAKDIDELKWPGVTILRCKINEDLQTKDLKKKQSTNESFWLMGSPDIDCKKQKDGKYIVSVNGFDYFNSKTGEVESGNASKIVMWSLDTDYDGRSVYPQQVFFPMDGKSGGWKKLAKTLHTYVDEDLITKYEGIESIPFEAGQNKTAAVKIIDDRGIESLKIIDLE
tara:strand:- start:530 stop:3115 length:2586 start_codon:yes stop_codon:yes gene_type:complete